MPSQGKLYVVGIGPGEPELLTLKAKSVLEESEFVLGHRAYIEKIRHIIKGEIIESQMGEEVERVKKAIQLAKSHITSLVSGGDPSIYGMASLVAEYVYFTRRDVNFEVVPGVTALCAASPLLGCVVAGDHAVLSLSDLLTPWEKIERKLEMALKGDFVVVIYNPSSKKRMNNLVKAMKIILKIRGNVPVGVVRNATREGENAFIISPEEIINDPEKIDMHTILFIPNSETIISNGKMITPRGYSRKYRW